MSDVMSGKTVDSRDVIARIEELEAEREALADVVTDAEADELEAATAAVAAWDKSDEGEELRDLKVFAEAAEGYAADWKHGETLISEGYFEQYARDLAEELDMIPAKSAWPENCIDWEQAAEELKQDYTEITYRGDSWLVR